MGRLVCFQGVLRGELKEVSQWDGSSQNWRSEKSFAITGQFVGSTATHGEALWVNVRQGGLWRQSPAGWRSAEEAERDWITSIRFWGDVDLACFQSEQCVARSFVHEYFHAFQRAESNERYYAPESERSSGPLWLLEGRAKDADQRYLNDRGLDSYDAQRSAMVRHVEGIGLTLRESSVYGSATPFFLGMSAWEQLVEKVGAFSLLGYHRNRALHASPEEALEATFGLALEVFQEEFEAWRAAGFPRE